jgi:hypothetical protein
MLRALELRDLMTCDIDFDIDLIADYAEIHAHDLQLRGFPIDPNATPEDICLRHHNLMKRLVSARPRKIHKSAEFDCPESYRAGLEATERDILQGNNLTPRLSRYIAEPEKRRKKPDFDDDLLNDWGIHHLHLGVTLSSKDVVEGTEYVLLAMFCESDAYLIGIIKHGDWSKQDIIQTVHRNWPETIAVYRVNYGEGLEGRWIDLDITSLREGHVNTLIEVEPGVMYVPPGGGFMTSGISSEVMQSWLLERRQLKRMEEEIKDNIVAIAGQVIEENNGVLPKLRFNLTYVEGKWAVIERATGLIVL